MADGKPVIRVNFGDYQKYISLAVRSTLTNLPRDLTIISGENEEIQTNKYLLSLFSPSISSLLLNACPAVVLLPDCSTTSIKHVINIINSGVSTSDSYYSDKNSVLATAKLLN